MTDHEQIRRDAEKYAAARIGTGPDIVRSLLAELEQAERARDKWKSAVYVSYDQKVEAEALIDERDEMITSLESRLAVQKERAVQAERERDEALRDLQNYRTQAVNAEAQLAAVPALVEALRLALDCKGPYNGKRSDRGGYPAVCCECVDQAERALAAWEQAQNG